MFWNRIAGWIGVCGGSLSAIFIIRAIFSNPGDNRSRSDSLIDLNDPVEIIGLITIGVTALLFVMSIVLYIYYYVKTANYLGIKSYLRRRMKDVYKEMEQIAKEKKWVE